MDDLRFGTAVVANETPVSPLPLQATDVDATVRGPVADVTVTQTFGNPFTRPITLLYAFPLPERAAIVDYTLTIGERVIRADVKEREAARRAFRDALDAGQRAGLLEEHQPNLFTLEVGNVQPGETITARLVYEDRLRYADGRYVFTFPMGMTPKFHDPATSPADTDRADRPFVPAGVPVADATLRVTVDAGVPLGDPASRTHPGVTLQRAGEAAFTATLTTRPDKDFELAWAVAADAVQAVSWGSLDDNGETHLVTLLPPPLDITADPAPREFIFVIDRSGSMGGPPMQQARNALRACVRALNPADTFTIQAFDDKTEWFSPAPQAVTQANVDAADRWLDRIDARGGTNILAAVQAALDVPQDATRQRYVVFLTDGAVSNDRAVLGTVGKRRGDARLFTFGIGPSVNRHLLSGLAEMGRGVAEYLGADEDIEGALTRFQDRVGFPVLTDLSLSFTGGAAWDTYPSTLPDMYIGEPLNITTRLTRTGDAALTLTGQRAGEPVTLSLALPRPAAANPMIRRQWARARVRQLSEGVMIGGDAENMRGQIIALGLTYHMATAYTAFVAVDSAPVADAEDAQTVRVAGPLPEGLNPDAFESPPLNVRWGTARFSAPASPSPKRMRSLRDTGDLSSRGAGMSAPLAWLGRVAPGAQGNDDTDRAFSAAPPLAFTTTDERLRWLARTQRVDGSWGGKVEQTAAAVLAFVRAGHTARVGGYRPALRKAYHWLSAADTSEVGAVARYAVARALAEHDGAAVPPAGFKAPADAASITTLDALRAYALLHGNASAPPAMTDNALVQTWLAVGAAP